LDGGNIDGNTSSVRVNVKKGSIVDNLPQPKKANCTFGGWFTETNGVGNEFTAATVVTSASTVFAKWASTGNNNERTVTFDLDGGNIGGTTTPFEIIVNSGGTITTLPYPTKSNNSFNGWFSQKNGAGNEFTATTQVTSDVTVYAKWTASNNGSDTGESTFVLTNIPVAYNGKYACLFSENENYPVFGFQTGDMETWTITCVQIANGKVNLPMWILSWDDYSLSKYSGNDNIEYIGVFIFDTPIITDENLPLRAVIFSSITFSKGTAVKSWNDGTESDGLPHPDEP
jgi:uncharacterized repeat protein (TIGR02543 family)